MRRGALVSFVLFNLLICAETRADEAKDLFNKAETQYRLGNFAEALANYKAALKIRRHPSLVFNIAQCYRKMNRPDKALFFYKLYLSDWARDNAKPPNFTEVQQHIDRLTIVVEESKQKAPGAGPSTARLRLDGLPDRATVLVGGVFRARAPLSAPLDLTAGEQEVRVEAEGYLPWSKTVRLAAGEQSRLDVTLKKKKPASRSTFWLVSGISTAGLAVGSGVLGAVYNIKANDETRDTPAYDDKRSVAITGYVLAGVFAAASAVSWVLWVRSGKVETSSTSSAAIVPTRGGAWMTGVVRF